MLVLVLLVLLITLSLATSLVTRDSFYPEEYSALHNGVEAECPAAGNATGESGSGEAVWDGSKCATIEGVASGAYGGHWYIPQFYEVPRAGTILSMTELVITFLLLYNNLWPISLFVAVELCKVVQARLVV